MKESETNSVLSKIYILLITGIILSGVANTQNVNVNPGAQQKQHLLCLMQAVPALLPIHLLPYSPQVVLPEQFLEKYQIILLI